MKIALTVIHRINGNEVERRFESEVQEHTFVSIRSDQVNQFDLVFDAFLTLINVAKESLKRDNEHTSNQPSPAN